MIQMNRRRGGYNTINVALTLQRQTPKCCNVDTGFKGSNQMPEFDH